MEKYTDEKLTELVKNGSEEAFDALMLRYLYLIRAKSAMYRAESVEFDDFVQEGLLSLLDAAKSYNPKESASFKTYAGVCISNRFSSIVRKANRKKDIPSNLVMSLEQDSLSLDDALPTPEQKIIDQENDKAINLHIKKVLSPLEYNVLNYYLGGSTYEEIASGLHLSPKSVDNALQRIRKKLKKG